MAFSEKIKNEVMKKSFFRCVICHDVFVEVHHIVAQSDGGADTIDNAAALCAKCHDLYGGNPNKRKQIKLIRDDWYEKVEKMTASSEFLGKIEVDPNGVNALLDNKVAIYHVVFAEENFVMAARMLRKLIYTVQQERPNQTRVLYLDIDGHRNDEGGFDQDMFELQCNFMFECIMPFLTEAHFPLGSIINEKLQRNDIEEDIVIFEDIK